jgi:hypothetical protein
MLQKDCWKTVTVEEMPKKMALSIKEWVMGRMLM